MRWIVRAVAIAIVIAGVVWLVRGLDLAAVGDVLARARWWPIVLAATINFGLIACKAIAWRILLGATYPVPIGRLFDYTVTSCAASLILPLRGGELIRLWLLRERDHVPIAHSTAVALAEKLLDIVAMLLVVAPLPWLLAELPRSIGPWIVALAIGAVAAIALLRPLAARVSSESWFGGVVAAMTVLHRPRVLISTTAVLVASWLVDLAMIALTAWAVGIDLSVGGGLLVLFAVNLTIAVPSTPGQVGALELGAVIGLQQLGVGHEQSLAFALTYHVLQVVPVAIAGLAFNGRQILAKGWRSVGN